MSKISARELLGVRLSSDHERLTLDIRDNNGQTVQFTLPARWMNTLLQPLPRQAEAGAVLELDSWRIDQTSDPGALVLTLRTPKGEAVSFVAQSFQVLGMATVARYGSTNTPPDAPIL